MESPVGMVVDSPPIWDPPGCGPSLLLDMQALPASVGEMISNKLMGESKLEVVSKCSILVSQNELCKDSII